MGEIHRGAGMSLSCLFMERNEALTLPGAPCSSSWALTGLGSSRGTQGENLSFQATETPQPGEGGLGMRAAAVGPRPGSRGPVPVAPFTQFHGSPLQDSLQLLPRTARHSPGQAGAPLRGHLLPGHLLGHELAGKARGAEHHQVERPLLGRHYEPTAMQGQGWAESTAPAPQAATPGPGAATVSSPAAAVSDA